MGALTPLGTLGPRAYDVTTTNSYVATAWNFESYGIQIINSSDNAALLSIDGSTDSLIIPGNFVGDYPGLRLTAIQCQSKVADNHATLVLNIW